MSRSATHLSVALKASEIVALFLIISVLLMRWAPTGPPEHAGQQPVLRLSTAGRFRIGIFADLHFGEEENGWGIDQDRNSVRAMRCILDREPLDLVVLNGDLITGENTFRENSSAYVHQIVQPIVDASLPWASVYGNHDSDFNLSREAIFEAEKEYALCYTDTMGHNLPGLTNYYIPIYPPADGPRHQNEAPALILWFFDSRGGHSYQQNSPDGGILPDWVSPATAAWYLKTHDDIRRRYDRTIPSIAFVHIPPRVFLQVQEAGLDPSRYPGLNDDVPLAYQGSGFEDSAFTQALLRCEGLHSIYVGHDHGDSWCSNWPGRGRGTGTGAGAPFLCFARHTGYGGYGTWDRGARILQVTLAADPGHPGPDDSAHVETWVRLEDGQVIHQVSLNETYGLDVYPSEIVREDEKSRTSPLVNDAVGILPCC